MPTVNAFITLSNGSRIPTLGLGTWLNIKVLDTKRKPRSYLVRVQNFSTLSSKPGDVKVAVKAAIEAGYRHIDTAYVYKNEREIGEALKEKIGDGTVKREDLFIVTKLWATFHKPERVEHALRLSLKALQLDYVDLYLMHSPMAAQYIDDATVYPGDDKGAFLDDTHYVKTWKAMEGCVTKGLTKSIGVSNFNESQLGDILDASTIPCVVNQVENHPYLEQISIIDFCKSKNVAVTSYSPLGSSSERPWSSETDPSLRDEPLVKEIADSKGCTPAQVLIAYSLCQGLICVPKSVTPSRIQQNFKASEVKLTPDDIQRLDTLSCGYRTCPWTAPRRTHTVDTEIFQELVGKACDQACVTVGESFEQCVVDCKTMKVTSLEVSTRSKMRRKFTDQDCVTVDVSFEQAVMNCKTVKVKGFDIMPRSKKRGFEKSPFSEIVNLCV